MRPDELQVGQVSHPGRVRRRNEDACVAYVPIDSRWQTAKGYFFAVADGVGGRGMGDVASQRALRVALNTYYHAPAVAPNDALSEAFYRANLDLYTLGHLYPDYAGLSTTMVAIVVRGGEAVIGNVGDSRAYMLRYGVLWPITRDHSWVAEAVTAGLLTQAEARRHPWRKAITRALGLGSRVAVDLFRVRLRSGDTLLLCSDGVVETVAGTEIRQALQGLPPPAAAHELVDLANRGGGPDNATALVIRYEPWDTVRRAAASPSPPAEWVTTPPARTPLWGKAAGIAGGVAGVAGIMAGLSTWFKVY